MWKSAIRSLSGSLGVGVRGETFQGDRGAVFRSLGYTLRVVGESGCEADQDAIALREDGWVWGEDGRGRFLPLGPSPIHLRSPSGQDCQVNGIAGYH